MSVVWSLSDVHVWFLMSYVCFQISDVWHRATNIRRMISNVKGLMFVVWSLTSDVCCQTSDVTCLMFVVWCQTSVVWCETSDVCCLMSDVWCHTSDILCLMFVVRRLTWESDIRQQASDIRHLMYDICFLTSDFCCLMANVWCSMSDVCSVIWFLMSDVCPCIRNPARQGSRPSLKPGWDWALAGLAKGLKNRESHGHSGSPAWPGRSWPRLKLRRQSKKH